MPDNDLHLYIAEVRTLANIDIEKIERQSN